MSRACTAGITLNLHNTSDRVVGLLFLDVLRAYAVRQRPHHISRIIELSHCAIGQSVVDSSRYQTESQRQNCGRRSNL